MHSQRFHIAQQMCNAHSIEDTCGDSMSENLELTNYILIYIRYCCVLKFCSPIFMGK